MINLKGKILFLIIGFFIGIIVVCIINGIILYNTSMNKIVNENIILEKDWLEQKLFSQEFKEEYKEGTLPLEEQLFRKINYLYKDKETRKLIGFDFEADSAYLGYTRIRYSTNSDSYNGIGGYFIYSLYDTNLLKAINASGQVISYRYNNKYFLFDDMRNELYVLNSNKLDLIEPLRQ